MFILRSSFSWQYLVFTISYNKQSNLKLIIISYNKREIWSFKYPNTRQKLQQFMVDNLLLRDINFLNGVNYLVFYILVN